MKKLRLLFIILAVFIVSTIVAVKILYSSGKILVKFEITDVENSFTNYRITYSKEKAADHYVIQIHDSSNRKVYETETKKTDITLSLTNLVNGENYSLVVYAYDKLGDYRVCENPYKFTWNEATFNSDASILLNNEDYTVSFDGDMEENNYYLKISSDGEEISKEKVNGEYLIDSSLYKDQEKILNLELLNNSAVVDTLDLYNNLNPVGDITITTPTNNSTIPYNDFTLTYTGGENASEFKIKISKDGKNIQTSSTTKNTVILSKNIFEVGSTYNIEVVGIYGDYSKSSSVTITTSDQIQLKPVYISNNWKYVKKGSKITLGTKDSDAKIYYTTNGDNPESFGTLYTEPIEINENTTLKCVSVKEGYENSIINTYEINVGEKKDLKVYLSPSNQYANPGVSETGYTNERDEMNDLSNYIQERLEKYGVKVYRNSPAGNINAWNRDSNYYGVDLHIAIHSNASENHDKYGVETWINTESSATYSLANLIQNDLMSIYPNSDLEGADRGVKYANGALGEANDNYIPFGMLVEVAHHDYYDDALWIMQNKKLIGYNIADSILRYYQIID